MYFALLAWRRAFGLVRSLGFVFLLGLAYPPAMLLVLSADSSWWSVVNSSAIVLWIQWCLGMVAVEAYYGIVELPRWCSTLWLAPIWAGSAVCSADRAPALSPLLWADLWTQLFSDVSCIALWINSEYFLTRLYSVLHWFHKRLEVNIKNPWENRCFQTVIIFSFGSVDNS